ncbi:hypothetical protein O1R50_24030 [Glycomyces luteolus]|uniref:Aminoglycoside phosphotransferase domain-containing protein n=1 Tax=Glycomyces luteolus TaxID=2670330 RepID=A0A9X3SSM1_9ACTN|nr:hypothetical protein [Glycomyces luteolus]MDA1362711.1 hypothetical protein [Glycomyces luteolus]
MTALSGPEPALPGTARTGPFIDDVFETVAREQVRHALQQLGIAFSEPLTVIPSVTSYVYMFESDVGRAVAKCSILGKARSSLRREGGVRARELGEITRAQREYAAASSACLDEARGLRLLTGILGTDAVPRVIGLVDGVLVVAAERASTPSVADRDVPDEKASEASAYAVGLLERLWEYPPARLEPTDADAVNRAHALGMVGTFRRKFLRGRHRRYVDRVVPSAELARGISSLVETIARTPWPSSKTMRLVYGDFKPEHVLLREGAQPMLIDPLPAFGWRECDIARFLMRMGLLSMSDSSRLPLLERVCAMLAARLPDDLDARLVQWFMAMDFVNIYTTRVCFQDQNQLPGSWDSGSVTLETVAQMASGLRTTGGAADPYSLAVTTARLGDASCPSEIGA